MTSTLTPRRSTAGSTAPSPTTTWTTSSTRLPVRIASFDKPALAEAKRLVNRRTLPHAEDLVETQDTFLTALSWPTLRERGATVAATGRRSGPEFELRFGHYLADLGDD